MKFSTADCLHRDHPSKPGWKIIEHVPTLREVEFDGVTVSQTLAVFGLKRMVEREA